jgi:hypothetical protein
MSKNIRARKFSYKGGEKKIVPLYSRNYVKKEEGDKNREVGLEPRLACVKKPMHDMLNMPMDEPCLVWLLK